MLVWAQKLCAAPPHRATLRGASFAHTLQRISTQLCWPAASFLRAQHSDLTVQACALKHCTCCSSWHPSALSITADVLHLTTLSAYD